MLPQKEVAAIEAVKKALGALDAYLATRTFLLLHRVTLADIVAFCNLYFGYTKVRCLHGRGLQGCGAVVERLRPLDGVRAQLRSGQRQGLGGSASARAFGTGAGPWQRLWRRQRLGLQLAG